MPTLEVREVIGLGGAKLPADEAEVTEDGRREVDEAREGAREDTVDTSLTLPRR